MEFSEKQKRIIESKASKVVVIASAAAGKTAVLVERVKWLIANGTDPRGIVLITFTNAAAEELSERLGAPQGLFIGTIHGYANYLLLSSGVDTTDLLDQEQFDKLFPRIKKNLDCIKPVEHLLLDESQDSTPEQFEFLLDIIKPAHYMLVGDHKQSIYRWNNADPQYLLDLIKQPDVITYDLNENYRNGSKILDYAKGIIRLAGYDYNDTSIPMRGVTGKVTDVTLNYIAIVDTLKRYHNYKDWFILARGNAQVDEVMDILNHYDVPCVSFKRTELSNKDMYQILNQDKVKVMTIHASKGLESPNVIVIGARFHDLEEICISYVAATRARDWLVWMRIPSKSKKKKAIEKWET